MEAAAAPAAAPSAALGPLSLTVQGASIVGNRAFTQLLGRRRTLARVGGWAGASTAVNQSESSASGYRRIPVDGLPAAGKALVLIPPGLDPSKPVDVILHLHGQNQGYKGDPQRDLDPARDRFEAQLATVGRPQLVAVLAQGSTSCADYGEFSQLKPRDYVEKALARVSALDGGRYRRPSERPDGAERRALRPLGRRLCDRRDPREPGPAQGPRRRRVVRRRPGGEHRQDDREPSHAGQLDSGGDGPGAAGASRAHARALGGHSSPG